MEKIKKIVVAYSGGLDTSIIVKWLKDKYGCDVVCYTADLGQNEPLDQIKEKAVKTGASAAYVEDLQEEFVENFVLNAIKANALYEDKYPMATALGRPLIAKRLVEIAHEENADAICHGSTGKGNDQVRFEVSIAALDPDIKVVAPLRTWELKSRDAEIEYAKSCGIEIPVTKASPYSIDRNIWGIAVECGVLEDPMNRVPNDVWSMTIDPQNAPESPEEITISFNKGKPAAINGKKLSLLEIIKRLNKIAGSHGVGRIDMVENRLVGIKSREVYEAPAAVTLIAAHKALEELIFDRETLHFNTIMSSKYSELVYYGWWFSDLRKALDNYFNSLQEYATGNVRVKFYKGSMSVTGKESRHSLYNKKLATYGIEDSFKHSYGEAFCYLWGLPLRERATNK